MSNTDDDLAQAKSLLAQLRRGRVVSLQRVRRLTDIIERLRARTSPRLNAQGFLATIESEMLLLAREFEARLLDRVQVICRDHPAVDVGELTSIVARDREFRRLNREVRWHRAVYLKEEVPEVHVNAHIRDGRPVREHWRLVGYEHLVDTDVEGREPRVRDVLACLIVQGHRRE